MKACSAWSPCLLALAMAASIPASGAREGRPDAITVSEMERLHSGALIKDGFDGSAIDEGRWRIWRSDPDRVRMEVSSGRLVIQADGPVGYNGLVSHASLPTRDVEMVCVAGVASSEPAQHPALVHLCGNGDMSPDNWFEVRLQDGGGKDTLVATRVSAPARWLPEAFRRVRLSASPGDGLLVKIISDPAARLVRGMVLVGDRWTQVGQALEVPAREARMEIKTEGFRKELGKTRIWFDDCRLYPRPQTHYVTVRLQGPEGAALGVPVDKEGWPLVLRDSSGNEFTAGEIALELYTGDGKTLVDRTHPGDDLRYAVFTLEDAPWETFPVDAVIRMVIGGRQVGGDLVIASEGVEGLYPDDVYQVTLE